MPAPITQNSYHFPNRTLYQPVQSLPETVPTPTNLYSGNSDFSGWGWACEKTNDGTRSKKWCTLKPTGTAANVITILLHLDPETGISVMLALPERCKRGKDPTGYWANKSIRSYVTDAVEKIMITCNLSACLHESILQTDRAQTEEENDDDEEYLMKAANTLMEGFNLNKLELTIAGNSVLYDVVVRRARAWDDIVTRERHANQKTLVRDLTSRRHTLPMKKGDRIVAQISSLGDSRVDEA
jgi:hypothetical protein